MGAASEINLGNLSYLNKVSGGANFPAALTAKRVVTFSLSDEVLSSYTCLPRGPRTTPLFGAKGNPEKTKKN